MCVCLLQGCVPQLPDAFTFMDFPLQQFVIIHTQLTPSLTHTLQAAQTASKGITVRHLVPGRRGWLFSGAYLEQGGRIKCMVTSKCFSFSKCKYVLKINVIFFWTTTSLHLCMISLRAELRLPEVSCLYFHG